MCVFILGQGDISPDLLFILHGHHSPLPLLLSDWLILSLCLEGRIFIFLEVIKRAWTTTTHCVLFFVDIFPFDWLGKYLRQYISLTFKINSIDTQYRQNTLCPIQLTCVSLSCFLKLLNLKKPSLSLNEGLFLMEPGAEAGAGQGMGLRGEVEGNLEERRWNGL